MQQPLCVLSRNCRSAQLGLCIIATKNEDKLQQTGCGYPAFACQSIAVCVSNKVAMGCTHALTQHKLASRSSRVHRTQSEIVLLDTYNESCPLCFLLCYLLCLNSPSVLSAESKICDRDIIQINVEVLRSLRQYPSDVSADHLQLSAPLFVVSSSIPSPDNAM